MLLNERDARHEHLLTVAKQMMTAARTAPKGKGIDIIEIVTLTEESIAKMADEMVRQAELCGLKFLLRDAENIRMAEAVLLIGTREQPLGLNCAFCGYDKCEMRPEGVPCAINSIDLGIAIGSACATAADCRVDTRVMFSVGLTARRLNLLPGCNQIIAIPMSATSKNPFFDRKPHEVQRA